MPVDVIVRSEVDDLHRGVWVGTSEEELEGTAEERTRPGIARPHPERPSVVVSVS